MSKKNMTQHSNPSHRSLFYGDSLKVFFFQRNSKLILSEECYFFLMASMRKMRLSIPLHFTQEYLIELLEDYTKTNQFQDGIITFLVYRGDSTVILSKSKTHYSLSFLPVLDVFSILQKIEIDLLKDITVNNHLLSNIRVHHPENIYAEVYAQENDLQDLILLNPQKRIARSIFGNLLFLENNTLKIPKQSEGAYISPLTESLLTHIHRHKLAEIQPTEMAAFESQKSDEILIISDEKGIFSVQKIRNKTFQDKQFQEIIQHWKNAY